MENRLSLSKDLLSDKGSFYLHLDYRVDFLGRVLLSNNFINNIIWNYGSDGKSDNYFGRKHDSIMV